MVVEVGKGLGGFWIIGVLMIEGRDGLCEV